MALRQPHARFAVIGQPVAHSLSPIIHKLFASQWAIDLDYCRLALAPAMLAEGLTQFAREGGVGANVTLPHKQAVLPLCRALTPRAQRAQSVNTLSCIAGAWHGDNTDGVGLINDLCLRRGIDLRGRRTLVLGAGGAAFGVAPALLDAGIDSLWVCNRTPERADVLVDALREPERAHTRYWQDLPELGHFDLIINATSAGREAQPLSLPFRLAGTHTIAIDLNYGTAAVDFLAWAQTAGCDAVFDGLGMLVEQAAESFMLWQGQRPDTEAVYAVLRQQVNGEGISE